MSPRSKPAQRFWTYVCWFEAITSFPGTGRALYSDVAITNALKRCRIWESPKKQTCRSSPSLARGARGSSCINASSLAGGGMYHDVKYMFHNLSGILMHHVGASGVLEQRNAAASSSSCKRQRKAGMLGARASPTGKSSDLSW